MQSSNAIMVSTSQPFIKTIVLHILWFPPTLPISRKPAGFRTHLYYSCWPHIRLTF